MDPPPSLVVTTLAARRRSLNLSQDAVAQRIGTSRAHLSRIETGHVDPSVSLVLRYAGAVEADLLVAEHNAP